MTDLAFKADMCSDINDKINMESRDQARSVGGSLLPSFSMVTFVLSEQQLFELNSYCLN